MGGGKSLTDNHSPVLVDESSLRTLKLMTNNVVIQDTSQNAYSGSGNSNSPFRTRGLDFQEIRAYQPGDDIRQIDWRTTAKYGKPFTKLYTDEKERPVYFVCDMRSRMKFASHGDFKSVVAARMTMFLAYLVEKKKDRIGSVILMPDHLKSVDLRGNGGTEEMIADFVVAGSPISEKTDAVTLEQALLLLAREAKNGAMIFICSDFSDLTESAIRILNQLSTRRTIALMHVYDEMEGELPYGLWTITDGQKTEIIDMTNKINREAFEKPFQNRITLIEETVKKYGWGYISVKTTDDYLSKLTDYMRKGRM